MIDDSESEGHLGARSVADFVLANSLMQETERGLDTALSEEDGPIDPESVKQAIRLCLKSLTVLAARVDRRPASEYSSHVMTFTESDSVRSADLAEECLFLDSSVGDLVGFLELQPDLSTRDFPGMPTRFVLPVALGSNLLPGAPRSLVESVADGFANLGDAAALRSWLVSNGYGGRSIKEVEEYLVARSSVVRSFVSLPLVNAGGDESIGVVNLQCSGPHLLGRGPEMLELYVFLARPILSIAFRLAVALASVSPELAIGRLKRPLLASEEHVSAGG